MLQKQETVEITKESWKKIFARMPNWKSPGPDLIQGFCLKNFSSLHETVRSQLKECLGSGFVHGWLTKGKTALLQKDKSKDNIASNYRPITYLTLMWKLLSDVIADQIYGHLDQQKLLSDEQEGCRKRSMGTNDLLYTDRAAIREGKPRKKNLSPLVFVRALIPLSLVLTKAKAAYEFSGSKEKINPLLFMDDLKLYNRSEKELDSLVQTIRIFSKDIGIETIYPLVKLLSHYRKLKVISILEF